MKRFAHEPRPDWAEKCEALGFTFHTFPEGIYWWESAHYEFTSDQVDELELSTNELYGMCIHAVDHVINNNLFHLFNIPEIYWNMIKRSWARKDLDLYGRFDLAYDGVTAPKMLEFNADTPTSLLEAAVVQWFWQEEVFAGQDVDQFNSIHERLVAAWKVIGDEYVGKNGSIYFGVMTENKEDTVTVDYLRDCASQAGINAPIINMEDIGWNNVEFTDLDEKPIDTLFKLYPWEWMIREDFGKHLVLETMEVVEPAWKLLLSNKALLPILWNLYPDHPNLLEAHFTPEAFKGTYVAKPKLAREGANVTIVQDGKILQKNGGEYSETPNDIVYQAYKPIPVFDGNVPVIGSWVVAGRSAGIGIRETEGLISDNTSRFIPHIFR